MGDEVRHDDEGDTSPPPAWLTVSQAARAAQVSERSIQRWLRNGRLSATQTPRGRRIALSELMRVSDVAGSVADTGPQGPNVSSRQVSGELLASLRAQVGDLQRTRDRILDELVAQREAYQGALRALPAADEIARLRQENEELRRRLAAPQQAEAPKPAPAPRPAPTPAQRPAPAWRSWLARIFGR